MKPANANKTLTLSAKRAERAKKREGKLRLEDHLKRFPNWSL
ncbi:TraY domain-containing protein [Vibrio crassostreae]|nr:TraY domain-containing protein [Vibrio crassostreae]